MEKLLDRCYLRSFHLPQVAKKSLAYGKVPARATCFSSKNTYSITGGVRVVVNGIQISLTARTHWGSYSRCHKSAGISLSSKWPSLARVWITRSVR